jgi:dihydroxyacetone kinase-like predicted kinase
VTVLELARAALASLEASRRRIDDLNVYPVPDGDTGTNLTLTGRGIVEALEASTATDRATVAKELTRAALMSARGNSGVILSQIVRGAAEVLAEENDVARALRGASDAAYRAVRRPVEGTMLTIVRELAEEAERRGAEPVAELLPALVQHGEEALARTPEQLEVLKAAGVVDAGGAGLLEIVRGISAGLRGEEIPTAPVETDDLDVAALESALDPLGDSLLVVGDRTALKVHVHTDEPGVALSAGVALGTIDRVEIANMHRQTIEREERLADELEKTCEAVAVVAGAGNRRLFASLGAGRIIEGGQTMNPSTQELLDAIEAAAAPEVVVLPNNSNVVMSAEQAARHASKPVRVVHTDSIPAGLAAMVAYDPGRSAEANVAEMHEALEALSTGEVTVASRDAEIDGVEARKGSYLGLVDGRAVAADESFEAVARAVLDRLLAEPRGVLTLLTGEAAPSLDGLEDYVRERHPDVELEVQEGGQPHYPLLVSAE